MNVNSSTLEHPVLYGTSVGTLLLVPPINFYVLLLIVRGGLETITSEFYCLNLAISDIFMCFFNLFYLLGQHLIAYEQVLLLVSRFFLGFQNLSRPLFQCCICVERYLAVVHPVIFLRYKLLRYKIMCCSVVWFITLGFCITFLFTERLFKVMLGIYIVSFSLMLFSCVSVLRALKRPGPGEGRRRRAEGNDAKTRAFNIIVITTVMAAIYNIPLSVLLSLRDYINENDFTSMFNYVLTFSIVNGLVNPFFYLQRAAKLPSFHFGLQRFMLTNANK